MTRPIVRTEQTYDERTMMRDDVPLPDAERLRQKWQQEKLSDVDKDRYAARVRELEEKVSVGMPTHTEMWRPTPENIEKHLRWERTHAAEIAELKQLRRRLEPSDPGAGRIEYLRKQGEADRLEKWL